MVSPWVPFFVSTVSKQEKETVKKVKGLERGKIGKCGESIIEKELENWGKWGGRRGCGGCVMLYVRTTRVVELQFHWLHAFVWSVQVLIF
jgi:hypothetical protein